MQIDLLRDLPSLVGLFIAGANCAIFIIIKFNDLVHMDKKLDGVVKTLNAMDEKLDNNAERISKLEGKCAANHG